MSDFHVRNDCSSDEQLAETLAQLVAASRAGELSEADAARLSELLEGSSSARQIYLRMAHDTQALRVWATAYAERQPKQTAPAIVSQPEDIASLPFDLHPPEASGGTSAPAMSIAHSPRNIGVVARLFGWKAAAAAACVAFLLTAGIAYRQSGELSELQVKLNAERMRLESGLDESPPRTLPSPPTSRYMATLVNVTNCRWDPLRSTADVDSGVVQPGQLLSLLEGVAEVNTALPSGGIGRFQLEGPLAMMLTSQGMPAVHYGKLAAQVSCDLDRFTFDTPMGRATISHEASIGLIVSVSEVELHIFVGDATFEPLCSSGAGGVGDPRVSDLRVSAGKSLKISATPDGDPDVHLGSADESRFVTQVSMAASQLHISDKYVAAVRQAKPVGYWRFESDAGGGVRNEMGDRLALRAYGDGVRWRAYAENRSAELGSGKQFGYLLSEDTIDGLIPGDYSLEAWIKPSHSHHGAVLTLTDGSSTATEPGRSGLLFELCGPSESWFSPRPGRFRFLHRNPPAYAGGNSCYSAGPYALRTWQHVVGLKAGSEMRLYFDGVLVGVYQNQTNLADGLRLMMGQLYPHDSARGVVVRPFVGELDEVALYNRALTPQEITQHYELARPTADATPARDPPDS